MYNAKTKKKRKNITLGIVYIKSTFNNTIVTFTDMQGNAIAALSAGAIGFKGAKKATPYAAQVIVEKVSEVAKEHGIKNTFYSYTRRRVSKRISFEGYI